jgi:hypothetical protein
MERRARVCWADTNELIVQISLLGPVDRSAHKNIPPRIAGAVMSVELRGYGFKGSEFSDTARQFAAHTSATTHTHTAGENIHHLQLTVGRGHCQQNNDKRHPGG